METKPTFQTINDTLSSDVKVLIEAKEKYDRKFCQKCKKLLPPYDDHRCARCSYSLCRSCDDNSDILRWVELSEDKDEYICYKCAGEKRKRKKKEITIPTIEGQ